MSVEGKGPPMLLIPGPLSSGDVWRETVAHYRDRYRIHVLTLAGFAGVPARNPPEFSIPVVRDAVLDYIQAETLDRPVVVGHSLGGVLAYALGIQAPTSFAAIIAVDGLPFLPALMNPATMAEGMEADADRIAQVYASMSPE